MNIVEPDFRTAEAAELLKAMSNERRLMVLCELGLGERTVGQLQRRVGISTSALSQHLALLRRCGLVRCRRQSREVHYELADPAVTGVISVLTRLYCEVDDDPAEDAPIDAARRETQAQSHT